MSARVDGSDELAAALGAHDELELACLALVLLAVPKSQLLGAARVAARHGAHGARRFLVGA
jgi:hypothetical protein